MLALVREEPEVERLTFEDFWQTYPRRQNKKAALAVWKRIDSKEHPAILEGIANWKRSEQWNRDGGQYIPLPSTFLQGERWTDEVEIGVKASPCCWPRCRAIGGMKYGSKDVCESHLQAFKRGETP